MIISILANISHLLLFNIISIQQLVIRIIYFFAKDDKNKLV